MNDPGSGFERRFSEAAGSAVNRSALVKSVLAFCKDQGFDGVDLDWEVSYCRAP